MCVCVILVISPHTQKEYTLNVELLSIKQTWEKKSIAILKRRQYKCTCAMQRKKKASFVTTIYFGHACRQCIGDQGIRNSVKQYSVCLARFCFPFLWACVISMALSGWLSALSFTFKTSPDSTNLFCWFPNLSIIIPLPVFFPLSYLLVPIFSSPIQAF